MQNKKAGFARLFVTNISQLPLKTGRALPFVPLITKMRKIRFVCLAFFCEAGTFRDEKVIPALYYNNLLSAVLTVITVHLLTDTKREA
ncbi:hypothetical protein [Bowmanella sp. JS7-9]|uniref:Uncharacterized protein n=1 Tax=Pseudobowmanella zhangzhouensis TaxID=1537679 RepID=A0ABW1XLA6_9ALTE|nr:hypothetical protein [Bowmanella sp. JS7-9]